MAEKVKKHLDKVADLKQKYKEVFKDVEVALNSLRTTKRISEHFPEAIPHLPIIEKRELALNLPDLRKKL